jgi:hypothetical protein
MFCPNCGKEIKEGDFCPHCGHKLGAGAPSKPAPDGANPTSGGSAAADKAKKVLKCAKRLVLSLSLGEKIIGIAAIVSFICFFLPWMRSTTVGFGGKTVTNTISGLDVDDFTGWIWLQPIFMLISLGLIYLAQRVSIVKKIKLASVQIVIGTFWAAVGVLGMILVGEIAKYMKGLMGGFGTTGPSFGLGIGWWGVTSAGIAIVVGAFLIQINILKKSKSS